MRFRAITLAAVLAAVLGAAGPALAHGDWGYGSRHDQRYQRYDREHERWHRTYWRPRYFRHGSYGYSGYQPYYYDRGPGCHRQSYWDGGSWGRRWSDD